MLGINSLQFRYQGRVAVLVFSPCAVEVGAEVDEKLELEEPAGGIEPLQWAHNLLREKHSQLNIITT